MPSPLDYGRPRSRRRWWWPFAVALVLTVATFFGLRAWKAHRDRQTDRQLYLQQVKYRQDFERAIQQSLAHPATRAATRASD